MTCRHSKTNKRKDREIKIEKKRYKERERDAERYSERRKHGERGRLAVLNLVMYECMEQELVLVPNCPELQTITP